MKHSNLFLCCTHNTIVHKNLSVVKAPSFSESFYVCRITLFQGPVCALRCRESEEIAMGISAGCTVNTFIQHPYRLACSLFSVLMLQTFQLLCILQRNLTKLWTDSTKENNSIGYQHCHRVINSYKNVC